MGKQVLLSLARNKETEKILSAGRAWMTFQSQLLESVEPEAKFSRRYLPGHRVSCDSSDDEGPCALYAANKESLHRIREGMRRKRVGNPTAQMLSLAC